jgi:hypothetical protein
LGEYGFQFSEGDFSNKFISFNSLDFIRIDDERISSFDDDDLKIPQTFYYIMNSAP